MLHLFAKNFRGFKEIDTSVGGVSFITGGNSSGKTSLIYLTELVLGRPFRANLDFLSTRRIGNYEDIVSPYFHKNSSISMGYFYTDNKDDDFKIKDGIILECQPGSRKSIAKKTLSIINGTQSVHINKRGNSLVTKFNEFENEPELLGKFIEEHYEKNKRGYKKSKLSGGAGEQNWIFSSFIYDEKEKSFMSPFLPGKQVLDSYFFGPIRQQPQHYYSDVDGEFDETGTHTPILLERLQNNVSRTKYLRALSKIKKFGKKTGLFDAISASKVDKSDARSPYKIEIERGGKIFSLDEVGYGVSQILPIIVQIFFAAISENKKTIIAIQQPEVHLHPRAQAEFGELLYEMSSQGIIFMIETHSDYLIDRFRYKKFKSKFKVDAQILYCENSSSGNKMHKIEIDDAGSISNLPKGYRDFFMYEQIKMMETI